MSGITNRQHLAALTEQRKIIRRQQTALYEARAQAAATEAAVLARVDAALAAADDDTAEHCDQDPMTMPCPRCAARYAATAIVRAELAAQEGA